LHEEESSQTETVPGTLLVSEKMKPLFLNSNFLQIKGLHDSTFYEQIPCRTAMRARFPLNGTYFQVNEVNK